MNQQLMLLDQVMQFKELKPTQKQYIIELMKQFNHTQKDITLGQIKTYHQMMLYRREEGGLKLGYPNWLIVAKNKVSKSVYGFPIPTESEMDDYLSGKTERVVDISSFSPMLKTVIKEYGLNP